MNTGPDSRRILYNKGQFRVSTDLSHQMITVIMNKVETTMIVEFQKYMDMFKSWGKQGDEAFFMELTEQEADEVRKQSLSKIVVPHVGVGTMVQDHEYSQQDEERSRSPSPPRIGFVGHVVKYVIRYLTSSECNY